MNIVNRETEDADEEESSKEKQKKKLEVECVLQAMCAICTALFDIFSVKGVKIHALFSGFHLYMIYHSMMRLFLSSLKGK